MTEFDEEIARLGTWAIVILGGLAVLINALHIVISLYVSHLDQKDKTK